MPGVRFSYRTTGYLERTLAANTASRRAAPKQKHPLHTTWFDNCDLIDINYFVYSNVLIFARPLKQARHTGPAARFRKSRSRPSTGGARLQRFRKMCFPIIEACFAARGLYFLAWARASATTRLKPS
jgi:hypothetical protein